MFGVAFRLARADERSDGHDKHDGDEPETEEDEKWFHDAGYEQGGSAFVCNSRSGAGRVSIRGVVISRYCR